MPRCFLYVIGQATILVPAPPFKIGVSTDIRDRLATLQTGSPVRLQVFHRRLVPADGRSAFDREKNLHWHFRAHQVHGEWFRVPLDEIVWAINLEMSDQLRRPERPVWHGRRRRKVSREQAAHDEWRQHRRDIGMRD